jgi:hypothetical protein
MALMRDILATGRQGKTASFAVRGLPLTEHAVARCRQRGIRSEVLDFVVANFDRDYDAGDGTAAISISLRRLAELKTQGVPKNLIDQASRTVLIMGEDGVIVTAMNKSTWFSRFHHGAERLSATVIGFIATVDGTIGGTDASWAMVQSEARPAAEIGAKCSIRPKR